MRDQSNAMFALVGVMAGMIGAWLNSRFTTIRERWNLKRELYTRLLENLGELLPVLNEQRRNSLRGDLDDDDLKKRDVIIREQLRKAVSVAAIMLPDQSLTALKAMQKEWEGAGKAES